MEWAVRLIGLFYLFGGVVLLAQATNNFRLQFQLSKVLRVPLVERAADAVVAVGGLLVMVSGMALLMLSAWAVVGFVSGWVIQATYLLWGTRWFAKADGVGARGRRRTLDAFAIYTLATGFVLWLPLMGLLR